MELKSFTIPKKYPKCLHLEQGRKLMRYFSEAGSRQSRIKLTFVINGLRLPKAGSVLEIGPGCGQYAFELCLRGYKYQGYDIVPENLELWKITKSYYDLDGDIKLQDICALKKFGKFDGILSISTFEHIYDQEQALRNCFKLLKPNGRMVIIDSNFFDPRLWGDLIFRQPFRSKGKYGGAQWLLDKGKLYRRWNVYWKNEDAKSIYWWKRNLPKHGFSIIEIKTIGFFYPLIRFLGIWPFLGSICIIAMPRKST